MDTYPSKSRVTDENKANSWVEVSTDDARACLKSVVGEGTVPSDREAIIRILVEMNALVPHERVLSLIRKIYPVTPPEEQPAPIPGADERDIKQDHKSAVPPEADSTEQREPSRSRSRQRPPWRGRKGSRRDRRNRSRSRTPRRSRRSRRSYSPRRSRSRNAGRGRDRNGGIDGKTEEKKGEVSEEVEKQIALFAERFRLKLSVVVRLHRGQFTFSYETLPGAVSTGIAQVTNFAGVQLLPATGIERRRIPSSAANYQVSAEVRIEAFNLFRRAGVPRGVDTDLWVPDGQRAHCLL
jgi:hypothetical protein